MTNCRQPRFHKKSQLLQLVDSQFFVDLQWIFHRISVGKWKNSYKMASISSKISVEVNSRLRGRSGILQQKITEKVDQLSTLKKNPTTVDSWLKKSRNSRFIVKSRLSTSRLGQCARKFFLHLFFYRDRLEALAGLIRPSRRKPKCDHTATRCHLLPLGVTGRDWS